jgi:lipoate-protein ligase A
MALDEAIAVLLRRGETQPTVRVYGWKPAAISIGYFQSIRRTLDLKKCARLGIPVVRRLTGGRAVLHDQEVTYSVIAPRQRWGREASVLDVYKHIGLALVAALERLGIEARLERPRSRKASPSNSADRSPCFSSAGRYEVMVAGRKLVGSAQRWLGDVVLQHGSVLLGPGHARIAALLPHSEELPEEQVAGRLLKQTVSLDSLLSREVSFVEAARALQGGFGETLSGALRSVGITAGERRLCRDLVRERYGWQGWTLRT